MKHAYLLHTGYGKTKLMLDKIMSCPTKPRVLLISTKNIVESSWQGEIDKWYPGQISYAYITGRIKPKDRIEIVNTPVDILALNTEMIDWYISHTTDVKKTTRTKNGVTTYYNTDQLVTRFDMLIVDESSLFKNYSSNRFKALKNWCSKIKDVYILSATPTPKNIEDLWSQIYLLDGGQRLGKNITAFRNDYGEPVPMYNGQTRWEYSQKAVDYILTLVKDIVTSVPVPQQPLFPEPVIKKTIIKPMNKTYLTVLARLFFSLKVLYRQKPITIKASINIAPNNIFIIFNSLHIHYNIGIIPLFRKYVHKERNRVISQFF